MLEELGRKSHRPILLAIRVPDSVDYCKFIGIDLERWLSEGLVDLLIVGGYTQLNPWEYSVALGHKYGVKVYPSLDEPRVRDQTANQLRSSVATYRGRALEAWSAGVDGIYMFNFFDPHSPLWRELGEPKALTKLERNYFACPRGPGLMPVPHQKFIRVSTLNPGNPIAISARVDFSIGEDLSAAGKSQTIALRLQFKSPPDASSLRVILNGTVLSAPRSEGNWVEFPLSGNILRKGSNWVDVVNSANNPSITLFDLIVAVK
jgi:hypothetical protein